MPLKLSDALLHLSCKIAEKLPHAAGLALAVAYCAASGQQIPAFVVGALAGDVAVKGVEGLCRMATDGASEAEVLAAADALASANARPIEELAAVIASLKDDLANLPEALRQNLLAQIKKEQRELHEQWGRRIMELVGAPPFEIICTVAELLANEPKVSEHGLIHVVDRPESTAIFQAFKAGQTKTVLLRGRALSGKTFLAFKVAQRWIASGGRVAWIKYHTDINGYINAVKYDVHDHANLPLLIWDLPFNKALDETFFESLQLFPGPAMITVRVGELNVAPRDLEALTQPGFKRCLCKNGFLNPVREKLDLFLGPVHDHRQVLSAIIEAHNYRLSLTESAKDAIAERMFVGQGADQTTLLGLGRAYLMALANLPPKPSMEPLDRLDVHRLEGPNRAALSANEQVKNIFAHTVGADEKEFLTALRLYKQWTFSEGMHEDVLTATIQACCDAGRTMRDCRADLTERGVLTHAPPWYWVWHDLQLDVAPNQPDDTANDVLARTVEHLARSLACATNDQSKKTLAQAAGGFAAKLQQNGLWREALGLHDAALHARRNLAEAHVAGEEEASALAGTCNLGILLAEMGQRPAALALFQEALKIYRDLAREQPKAYLPNVAMTCNNLGALFYAMGQHAEAAKRHAEALMIRYACWLELPAAYAERLGKSLAAIRKLATNTEFSGRQQWLAELWRGMLGRFGGNLWLLCLPLCQTFAEAGLPALAMEPYVLLAITLEKQQDPAAAAQAAALVESLRPALGAEFEPLRQGLRAKFAPLLADL
ncbi:hypothetical protein Deba_0102 [Desulfarculus baarsii DSM 2075]|uniref:TPR repeat-containing protein n=1 Tax=Desulfarculus baarsii (strain ATCC 33931 / DSM 2075 / LMG 7858 / VKM B-1802 / 2st14) TaxID=644282 RepID=E1QDG2_DESB2|nr:tetratricopeptide repeat protein [Desulfarculus baarsii]ADK83481.1 hypothetical protein Deba_0102 [Desulfarculus baarsii DSM 2075]